MSARFDKLLAKHNQLVEELKKTNSKLDKICGLLVSAQLLQESVDIHGEPRAPEECANMVMDAFSAGYCLTGDMDDSQKAIDYSVSEFFLSKEEAEQEELNNEDEEEDPPSGQGVSPIF